MEQKFMEKEAMELYLKKLDYFDIRSENYINEGSLLELPNNEICIDSIADELGVNKDEETINALRNAMSTTGVVWRGPINGSMQTLPVNELALKSLSDRAGLYGPSVRQLPLILNHGFSLYTGKAKTLVRHGELLASHSDKYRWLPQGELFTVLSRTMDLNFPGNQFLNGSYSDAITTATFTMPEQAKSLLKEYNEKAKSCCEKQVKKIMPAVKFTTSDIGLSGANLRPYLITETGSIPLGRILKCTHDNKNDVTVFAENCNHIMDLIKDSTNALMELMDIQIKYPEDCFKNIVKKYHLPLTEANQVYEEFALLRPANVSAHMLYIFLTKILTLVKDNSASTSKLLDLEETFSRIINSNFKAMDTPLDI